MGKLILKKKNKQVEVFEKYYVYALFLFDLDKLGTVIIEKLIFNSSIHCHCLKSITKINVCQIRY